MHNTCNINNFRTNEMWKMFHCCHIYRPHPKDGEGNSFTLLVCPQGGRGGSAGGRGGSAGGRGGSAMGGGVGQRGEGWVSRGGQPGERGGSVGRSGSVGGGVGQQGGQLEGGVGQQGGGVVQQGGRGGSAGGGGVSRGVGQPGAGGMPLAFTQEDFLVNFNIDHKQRNSHHRALQPKPDQPWNQFQSKLLMFPKISQIPSSVSLSREMLTLLAFYQQKGRQVVRMVSLGKSGQLSEFFFFFFLESSINSGE